MDPDWRCISYSKWWYSIAMLVYHRVIHISGWICFFPNFFQFCSLEVLTYPSSCSGHCHVGQCGALSKNYGETDHRVVVILFGVIYCKMLFFCEVVSRAQEILRQTETHLKSHEDMISSFIIVWKSVWNDWIWWIWLAIKFILGQETHACMHLAYTLGWPPSPKRSHHQDDGLHFSGDHLDVPDRKFW